MTRLASRYDAVCTVKKDHLILLPTGGQTNASGQTLGAAHITRQVGDQHRYHVAGRTSYDGVRAKYHDVRQGSEQTVVARLGGRARQCGRRGE